MIYFYTQQEVDSVDFEESESDYEIDDDFCPEFEGPVDCGFVIAF